MQTSNNDLIVVNNDSIATIISESLTLLYYHTQLLEKFLYNNVI